MSGFKDTPQTTIASEILSRRQLEQKFDIETMEPSHVKTQLTGFLFNVQPYLEFENPYDGDKLLKRSSLSMYFIDPLGKTFRINYFFKPYFYIRLRRDLFGVSLKNFEHLHPQIVQLLEIEASDKCADTSEITISMKIDTSVKNHILRSPENGSIYAQSTLIRLEFMNYEDLRLLLKEVSRILETSRNTIARLQTLIQQSIGDFKVEPHIHTELVKSIEAQVDKNPFLLLESVFEADISLAARFMIDLDVRCGQWYHLKPRQDQFQIELCPENFQPTEPCIRYLAWDIEVTKEPFKFPNMQKDSIIMISYMCDGLGYLIVNREFVAEDIPDFEYSPRKEFLGRFHIYNVPNEKETILQFYRHIHILRPHIFVTYNGDNFDFEFLRIRSEHLGISLINELGFPYANNNGIPPRVLGLPTRVRTVQGDKQEFQGRIQVHIDCLKWVERDSYLPCGSRGLKAVTRAKLGYEPRELDPELMLSYASSKPRILAEYSVSDAVATYYLYEKYIHNFTYAMSSLIPLSPGDVLRKGSGTLCEHLLMANANKLGILIPNKHQPELERWHQNKLLLTETYSGGSVAQLHSGIYRGNLEESFVLNADRYQYLIDSLDEVFAQWFANEDGKLVPEHSVKNLEEIKSDISQKLDYYRRTSQLTEFPLIYHFDVGAMYPNIILTNRLQPTSILSYEDCAMCPYFDERNVCQRIMEWQWKAEHFPLSRKQIEFVKDQLCHETFYVPQEEAFQTITEELSLPKNSTPRIEIHSDDSSESAYSDSDEEGSTQKSNFSVTAQKKSWNDLSLKQQTFFLHERLKLISRKQSLKFKVPVAEQRTSVVCMRENEFYVETVRKFRDHRYIFKMKKKHAEEQAKSATDPQARQHFLKEAILYDSLQIAHKCILNSFYGYVMRKGSRWFSLEMAAVVTYTGAQIIQDAYNLCQDVGKPLELDTDGIWTLLPQGFPQNYTLEYTKPDGTTAFAKMNYFCTVLNYNIHKRWANHQYLTYARSTERFTCHTTNDVFFEVDGPYFAMMLPASDKEGQSLKKRYAVFDNSGKIVELKGFEIKRRGELEILKIFQQDVFPEFLKGATLQETYQCVALIANRWLDFLDSKGKSADDLSEVLELIKESKFLTKSAKSQKGYKSMGITTAMRLTELLSDTTYMNDKGISCQYVVLAKPDMEKTLRAVPIQLFENTLEVQKFHLERWMGLSPQSEDFRELIDWDYYKQRLSAAILKIIIIPALSQGLPNPVNQIKPPPWLVRANSLQRSIQSRLTTFFSTASTSNSVNVAKIAQVSYADNAKPFSDLSECLSTAGASDMLSDQDGVLEKSCAESKNISSATDWSTEGWVAAAKVTWGDLRKQLVGLQSFASQQMDFKNADSKTTELRALIANKPPHSSIISSLLLMPELSNLTWTILDIEPTAQPGILWFHIVNENLRLLRVPVCHKRKLIVNTTSDFTMRIPGTQVLELPNPENYTLPRRQKAHRLYEVSLSESVFQKIKDSLRPYKNIIAIHGRSTPLELDLLRCYGNAIRFKSSLRELQIERADNAMACIVGPDAVTPVELSPVSTQRPLRWIYLYAFMQQKNRLVAYLIKPSCPRGNAASFDSNLNHVQCWLAGGTEASRLTAVNFNLSTFFEQRLQTMENAALHCLDTKKWQAAPIQTFASSESMMQSIMLHVQAYVAEMDSHRQKVPVAVFLASGIPLFMWGDWLNPASRQKTLSSRNLFMLYNDDRLTADNIPPFSNFYFIEESLGFTINHFVHSMYRVEWSTVVANATSLPMFKALRWSKSVKKLQTLILDAAMARVFAANHMVTWDSDMHCPPDLGTPSISPDDIADFEIPDALPVGYVAPQIALQMTCDLRWKQKIVLETIMNLTQLARVYNDHFSEEISGLALKTAVFSGAGINSHGGQTHSKSSKSLRLKETARLPQLEPLIEEHTSQVHPKVLLAFEYSLQYMKSRFQLLESAKENWSMGNSATAFLNDTLERAASWIGNTESYFYDPASTELIDIWLRRYTQSLLQKIHETSQGSFRVLFLDKFRMIMSFPCETIADAQSKLNDLFEKLRVNKLFASLQPEVAGLYHKFALLDAFNMIGFAWEKKTWAVAMSIYKYIPASTRLFFDRMLKNLVLNSGDTKASVIKNTSKNVQNALPTTSGIQDSDEQLILKCVKSSIESSNDKLQDWIRDHANNATASQIKRTYAQRISFLSEKLTSCTSLYRQYLLKEVNFCKAMNDMDTRHLVEIQPWPLLEFSKLRDLNPKHLDATNLESQFDHESRTNKSLFKLHPIPEPVLRSHMIYYTLSLHPAIPTHDFIQSEDLKEALKLATDCAPASDYKLVMPSQIHFFLKNFQCESCNVNFNFYVFDTLRENEKSNGEPTWFCPACGHLISKASIELALINFLTFALEAVQVKLFNLRLDVSNLRCKISRAQSATPFHHITIYTVAAAAC